MWNISSSVTTSKLIYPMHEGNFYCQVTVDGNIESLSPSIDLYIGDQYIYLSEHPCTLVISQDTIRCAGNVDDVLSSSTLVPEGETIEAPTQPATSLPLSTKLTTDSPAHNLWVYILVAITTVFGMIILVLVISIVGLCLKKKNGMDSFIGE